MKTLPDGVQVYRRTLAFTEDTVPKGLLGAHRTGAGVWGRIVIESGRLQYDIVDPPERHMLSSGQPGIVEPETPHSVTPLGPVRFFVEFLR